MLLENLRDEEDKDNDHPKLWKQFAMALGADKNKIEDNNQEPFTKEMIDNFFKSPIKFLIPKIIVHLIIFIKPINRTILSGNVTI